MSPSRFFISNVSKVLLFFLVVTALAPTRGWATIYQPVRVNVLSSTLVIVEGKRVPMEELASAIKSFARGKGRIRALVYISLPPNKPLLKEVMARCREGGATAFTVVYKS